MTGGFGFPTIENHWSYFIKKSLFRKKAFPSPQVGSPAFLSSNIFERHLGNKVLSRFIYLFNVKIKMQSHHWLYQEQDSNWTKKLARKAIAICDLFSYLTLLFVCISPLSTFECLHVKLRIIILREFYTQVTKIL